MTGEGKKTLKFTRRVQFKLVAAFFALIAALLVLLNTYPVAASRDIVFSEKESSLIEQAAVISSSLSGLDTLSGDGAAQVVELLAVSGLERIIVTDAASRVLYDTASPSAEGDVALLSEIVRALSGEQVFWSRFAGGAFVSHAAIPIYRDGAVLGAVYLCERDTEQAEILLAFRDRLATVSIVALMAALGLTIVFTRRLTGRITRLSQAVRTVREGDYAHRVTVEGNDELSELYADFNSMTETLQKTEEQRRRFVSDASHELKTPLTVILTNTELLQSPDYDEAQKQQFTDGIRTMAQQMRALVERLLELARAENARPQAAFAPVCLSEVAETSALLFEAALYERGLTLETQVEPELTVSGDERQLGQLVEILLDNARKYASGGTVRLQLQRSGRHSCHLSLENEGPALSPQQLQEIFKRFTRADPARTRSGSFGLGLAIAQAIVQAHHGKIWAESRDGCNTFHVELPLRAGREKHQETSEKGI